MSSQEEKEKENELESYTYLKEAKMLDLSIDIIEYCRKYNPILLEYVYSNDLVDLLSSFIDFKNPFIANEDKSESDDEEYMDELNS